MAQFTDYDTNSNGYFYITDLPEKFGGGKNSFTVNPTNQITAPDAIVVSVYDSSGNLLPTKIARPGNSTFGGQTNTGTIYTTDVSQNVVSGVGKITIVSSADSVEWNRNILIDTSTSTKSEVSFFSHPFVDITPEIRVVGQFPTGSYAFGSGTFYSNAVFPKNNYTGDYDLQFSPTIYQIYLKSGSPFSSAMEGEKIRLKNVSVKNFSYTNNANNLTYTGTINTDFIATIERVISDNTLLINIPFRTVGDIVKLSNQDSEYAKNNLVKLEGYAPDNDPTKQSSYNKKNFYVLSLSDGIFEVIYKNISTTISDYVISGSGTAKNLFLNVEFRDIRVLAGSVSSYKIYGKSLNYSHTKRVISSGEVEASEAIVSTNLNNGYYGFPGKFYSQNYLSRFWLANGATTFYQTSSVLINGAYISHSGNTTETDYVIFKDDALEPYRNSLYSNGNLMNGSYWYAKNPIMVNEVEYPSASFSQASLIPQVAAFVNSQENLLHGTTHNSNPIKLVGNCLYNFSMRVRAASGNSNSAKINVYFINGSEVNQIGLIDSSFNFGANELYTNSFFVGNTKYGTIKLVPITGAWHISDISIKPHQNASYSPDYFSVKVPLNISTPNELIEVEAELFDGSDKLCYGKYSYTFAYNTTYQPLKKQIQVDPYGYTIRAGGSVGGSTGGVIFIDGGGA